MSLGSLLLLVSFALLTFFLRCMFGFSRLGGAPLLEHPLRFGLGQPPRPLRLLRRLGRFVTVGISCGRGLSDKERYRIGASAFVCFYLPGSLVDRAVGLQRSIIAQGLDRCQHAPP